MKKLILGLVAVGVVMALRPVLKRRMLGKMREHCKEMMGQCACGSETTAHDSMSPETMREKMREHCDQTAAPREPVATA